MRHVRRFEHPADGLAVRLKNLHRPAPPAPVQPLSTAVLETIRHEAYERVADVVARLLGQRRASGSYVGRRLARDMRRTLWLLTKGDSDTKVSTLADIAAACGYELHVVFKRKAGVNRLGLAGSRSESAA